MRVPQRHDATSTEFPQEIWSQVGSGERRRGRRAKKKTTNGNVSFHGRDHGGMDALFPSSSMASQENGNDRDDAVGQRHFPPIVIAYLSPPPFGVPPSSGSHSRRMMKRDNLFPPSTWTASELTARTTSAHAHIGTSKRSRPSPLSLPFPV